jgi:hypothetical protein
VTTFYVGSWFLVTYLLNGEADAFGQFQKQLHRLVPWRRAWDESFAGMTTAELDQKLLASAATPELAKREMQAALELDPNELNALSVQFRASDAEPPELRQRIAERATAAHPSSGEAWLLLALSTRARSTRRCLAAPAAR